MEWNESSIISEDKCVFLNGAVFLKRGLINAELSEGTSKGKTGRVIKPEILVKKDQSLFYYSHPLCSWEYFHTFTRFCKWIFLDSL